MPQELYSTSTFTTDNEFYFLLGFIPYFLSFQLVSNFGGTLKPIILPEIVQAQQEEVRRVFWAECVRPKEYVREYDKYTTLVSRQAEEDMEQLYAVLWRSYTTSNLLTRSSTRHARYLVSNMKLIRNDHVIAMKNMLYLCFRQSGADDN